MRRIVLCAFALCLLGVPVGAQGMAESLEAKLGAADVVPAGSAAAAIDRAESMMAALDTLLEGVGLTKEQRTDALKLRDAVIAYRKAAQAAAKAEQNYNDYLELKAEGAASGKEVTDALEEWNNALAALETQFNELRRTKLSLLEDAIHLSVVSGYQYLEKGQRRMMQVMLRNDSDVNRVRIAYPEQDEADLRNLLKIENLYVSVLESGQLIGEPYEQKVRELPVDEEVSLTFHLQRAAEQVTVQLSYLSGTEPWQIYLEKRSGDDVVQVDSMQFAQEGALGNNVSFDIELERLAEDEKTFKLIVINLPEQLRYEFKDKATSARMSQVKFRKNATTISMTLDIYVPEKLDEDFLDVPIHFFAVVADQSAGKQIETLAQQYGVVKVEELDKRKVGYERLELTPTGVGEMKLKTSNLYQEITGGAATVFRFALENTGTVELRKVEITTDLPYQWKAEVTPEIVDKIAPGQEREIVLKIIPIGDVGVGTYEVTIGAETEVKGEPIEAEDKTVEIHNRAKSNVAGSLILVVVLLGLLVGLAAFSIKLSRR